MLNEGFLFNSFISFIKILQSSIGLSDEEGLNSFHSCVCDLLWTGKYYQLCDEILIGNRRWKSGCNSAGNSDKIEFKLPRNFIKHENSKGNWHTVILIIFVATSKNLFPYFICHKYIDKVQQCIKKHNVYDLWIHVLSFQFHTNVLQPSTSRFAV